MTNAQKLELRASEIRERLNELGGTEDLDDDGRAEIDKLTAEFRDVETRRRALIVAEGDEARKRAEPGDETGDSESRELARLETRASVSRYLRRAASGTMLDGVEAEVNAAHEVEARAGGIAIPWAMLATEEPRPEKRVATTTAAFDGTTTTRPILERLFGAGIFDALGVRLDAVPVGRAEWPLITAGVAPQQKAEGAAADDSVATTFKTETLKPRRLTGEIELTHELAAQVVGVEQALRRDLADAVMSAMQQGAISGARSADGQTNSEQVRGFFAVLERPTDAPGIEANFARYARAHALAVDGVHASMETEVGSVLGTETYQHAAGVLQSGSGEAATEVMARRSRMCVASSYIPAKDSSGDFEDVQDAIFHAGGPNGGRMRGDSVAAIWPTLEVVRDPYTKASTGVVLTWVSLWDLAAAFRTAAYDRQQFKLG